MTRQFVAIGLFRVVAALPVLRWPLVGGLLAVAADLADLVLMNYVFIGGLGDYQRSDKLWDLAYLLTFLVVTMRWEGLAQRVAWVLFGLRLVGVAAFELGGPRALFVWFPNLFEPWFLLVAARDRFAPDCDLTLRRTVAALVALLALKLPQEYLLHVDRRLDAYTLPEFVDLVRAYLRSRL